VEKPIESSLESRWRNKGLKAGRCQYIQASEEFSMGRWDIAIMEFPVATDVGKFPPKRLEQ
jgi:hypothetical protein